MNILAKLDKCCMYINERKEQIEIKYNTQF